MQLESGMSLAGGRYRLESRLGEGGFGEVWRALDAERGAPVALKLLHPELAARPLILERFEREILIGVWLSHRAIPPVLDAGFDAASGRHFFSMAFVDGRPLGTEPLDLPTTLALFVELLDVLAYAHARGVVHRDLKPANVLVVREADGRASVRLLDFGIVRVAGSARAALTAGTPDEEDKALGSVYWMSPEQASGEAASAGPSSDLYALGVMLFELLSGQVPFTGSLANVIFAHIMRPPPQLELRPDLEPPPPDVWRALTTLLDELLAKAYVHRPEFASDVRPRLAALLAALPRDASAHPARTIGEQRSVPMSADTAALAVDDRTLADGALDAPPEEVARRTLAEALPSAPASDETRAGVAPERVERAQAVDLNRTVAEPWEAGTLAPQGASGSATGIVRRNLVRSADPPLAGRTAERAALLARVDELVGGRCASVLALIHGPPGIGKSRLARWLAEHLHERGLMRVLRFDLDGARGLMAALRVGLLEHLRHPRLEPEPVQRRIGEVLGLVGERLEQLATLLVRDESGLETVPPRYTQHALVQAALHPHRRPLLVWLDGAGHEPPSLVAAWCASLVELAAACGARLMVVWSCDPGATDAMHAVTPAGALRLELSPLDAAAQLELVASLGVALPAHLARPLLEHCAGNPRVLREIVLELMESGALRRGQGADTLALPRLEDLVRARVARFVAEQGAAGEQVLFVLAFLGDDWTAQQLARLSSALTVGSIDLVAAGLLAWRRGPGRQRLGFSSPALRQLLHARALAHPQRSALLATARDLRLEASLDAMGWSRWAEAHLELDRCAAMLDEAGLPHDAEDRLRLLDLRARIASRQGNHRSVSSLARELLDASARLRFDPAPCEPRTLTESALAWRAIACQWLAHAAVLAADPPALEAALEAAREAAHRLSRTSEARARLALVESLAARSRGDLEQARRWHLEARRTLVAVSLTRPPERRLCALYAAQAALGLAEVLSALGRFDEALSHFGEALAGFRQHDDPQYEARAHLLLVRHARLAIAAGNRDAAAFALAESHLEAAATLLDSLDDVLGQAMLVWEAGRLTLERGDTERALLRIQEAWRLFQAVGNASGVAACANALGEIHRSRGELQRAGEFYRAVVDLGAGTGNQLHRGVAEFNLAAVLRALEQHPEALGFAARAAESLRSAPLPLRAPALLLEAELTAARGDLEQACVRLAALRSELAQGRIHDADATLALERLAGYALAARHDRLAEHVTALRAALE